MDNFLKDFFIVLKMYLMLFYYQKGRNMQIQKKLYVVYKEDVITERTCQTYFARDFVRIKWYSKMIEDQLSIFFISKIKFLCSPCFFDRMWKGTLINNFIFSNRCCIVFLRNMKKWYGRNLITTSTNKYWIYVLITLRFAQQIK